jgi:Cys-tRNA(Pro)/Cys-tRNA(Cys) deacylase
MARSCVHGPIRVSAGAKRAYRFGVSKKAKKQATPALDVAESAGITYSVHAYEHDPSHESFGIEAAEKLGIDPLRVFKTLIVANDKELCVGVVPAALHLDLKAMASALNVKSVVMADVALAERTTGYVAGGISALGQKKKLRTVLDDSMNNFNTVHVSAGRRGLEIELAPSDLAQLTDATFAPIAR